MLSYIDFVHTIKTLKSCQQDKKLRSTSGNYGE